MSGEQPQAGDVWRGADGGRDGDDAMTNPVTEAELAATPPTLEWLRQQFGEPDGTEAAYVYWVGKLTWHRIARQAYQHKTCRTLPTRAAVLAAMEKQ